MLFLILASVFRLKAGAPTPGCGGGGANPPPNMGMTGGGGGTSPFLDFTGFVLTGFGSAIGCSSFICGWTTGFGFGFGFGTKTGLGRGLTTDLKTGITCGFT